MNHNYFFTVPFFFWVLWGLGCIWFCIEKPSKLVFETSEETLILKAAKLMLISIFFCSSEIKTFNPRACWVGMDLIEIPVSKNKILGWRKGGQILLSFSTNIFNVQDFKILGSTCHAVPSVWRLLRWKRFWKSTIIQCQVGRFFNLLLTSSGVHFLSFKSMRYCTRSHNYEG